MDISYKIVSGFDGVEKQEPFMWHWAIEKNALLEINNNSKKNWICKIFFTIGTPPGIQHRTVDILLDEIKIKSVYATEFYEMNILMMAGERKILGFSIRDDLIKIESDSRRFAFQLFDFQIEKEKEFFQLEDLKEIQQIQADLLQKVIAICEKHNLRYYLIYGSLLGAIRHRGMIPWDDDIDLVMFRSEYEEFLRIAEEELNSGYYLQTPEKGEDCFYGGYAKLRKSDTAALDRRHLFRKCNQGIFLDIFPLDNLPVDAKKRKYYIKKIKSLQGMIYIKKYGLSYYKYNKSELRHIIYCWFISRFYSEKKIIEVLKKTLLEINDEDSGAVAILTRYSKEDNLHFYLKEDFGEGMLVPFDSFSVRIPINYMRFLEQHSGKYYMKFPTDEARKPHHEVWWDAQISYNELRNKLYVPKEKLKKVVIIYGLGKGTESFLKEYKGCVECIISERIEMCGKLYKNIFVFSFEQLEKYPKDVLLVICADDFQAAKRRLLEEGFYNYKIYVEHERK